MAISTDALKERLLYELGKAHRQGDFSRAGQLEQQLAQAKKQMHDDWRAYDGGLHELSAFKQLYKPMPPPPPPQDPNDVTQFPALASSIKDLRNLWAAKWDTKWVSPKEFNEDPFWLGAFLRMKKYSLFEEHVMPDSNAWYRLREELT